MAGKEKGDRMSQLQRTVNHCDICTHCNGSGKVGQLLMSDAALQKLSELAKMLPNEPIPVALITCPKCFGNGVL